MRFDLIGNKQQDFLLKLLLKLVFQSIFAATVRAVPRTSVI